jgi:signal transduction histidine kinase/integral membrane sensor domain MASE1
MISDLGPRGSLLGTPAPPRGQVADEAVPRPPLRPGGVVAFAAAYAVLTLLGRMTVVHGQSVSLIWPAAGVAVLWVLAESPRHVLRALLPLYVVHAAMLWLTSADGALIVLGSLSITVQTGVLVALLRRWCPRLLGAGGTRSVRSPRDLTIMCLATVVGCAAGAAIGTLALWNTSAEVDAWTAVAWFARHVAGVLAVGVVGHLAWEWRTQPVPARAHGGTTRELALLWAFSFIATTAIFVQGLPLAYLVMSFGVWSAARFRTFPAALHGLTLGVLALWLTLEGLGPFARLRDPVEAALVSQVFVVAALLTGLGIGALGDRIDALYAAATEARRQAAEQAQLLTEMTESMREGLIVLDAGGRVDRSNGASRWLAHQVRPGVRDEEALAELVDLVLHPAPGRTGASRPELGAGDVVLPLDDGAEMVLAVTRTTLGAAADDVRGVLLVMREVTDHRSGLRPLATFASTAAHDLSGPLSAARSWLAMAVEDLDEDSEALDSLRRAERSTEQMGLLVGDLLAHAMAESGELASEDVALSGAEGVLALTADLLGPDDELVVPDGLPAVHADPVAVRQLFGNLVGNAVKYAAPGAPARVEVRAERRGDRVVVEVADHGIGVAEDERSAIFERFHRSDAVRRDYRGTGMGLSICQAVVVRHGGTIECLARPDGTGSVFRFDLPAAG